MVTWKRSIVTGLIVVSACNLCSGQGEKTVRSTLTREAIHQAVEKARKGDSVELHRLTDSVPRDKNLPTRRDLLPDFEGLLTDSLPEAQYLGALGLFALKDCHSVQLLSEFLKGKAEGLRAYNNWQPSSGELPLRGWEIHASVFAVKALGEIGDRSVVTLLESLQGMRAIQVEWGGWPVEEALAQLGSFRSLTHLKAGEDHLKIQQATDTIRGIKDANAAPDLMSAVRDQGIAEEIRVASLSALGGIKAPDVPGFLVKILDDPNMLTRMRCVAAIGAGRTGDGFVEAALKRHAEDRSSPVRADAFMGLVVLRPAAYLDQWFHIIADVNEVPEFRSRVAGMDSRIPRQLLRERKADLYACLSAVRSDGRSFDEVRGDIWMLINHLFQEEPTIVLSTRSGEVARRMSGPIERRIMQANHTLEPEDVQTEVNKALEKLIQVQ